MSEALQQLAAESGVVIDPPTCATTFGSEVSYAVVDYAREKHAKMIVLGVRQASLLASHVPGAHHLPHHHRGQLPGADDGVRLAAARGTSPPARH